ncbi:MAG: tetratricopeptide repeat protein [FCB group bacterium]|nr:tetratricopeptide repeat protein [FCB group bacterium]
MKLISWIFTIGIILTPLFSQTGESAAKKRARLYLQQGDLDRARDLYEQWSATHPTDTQTYRELINIYRRMGDFATMESTVRHRLKTYPNDMQAQMELGEALFLQDKPDSARQAWDRFRIRYGNNQTAIRMLVFTFSRLNLETDLVKTITLAREQFSDPGFMAQDLANYYQLRRDYSHAVDEYLRLLLTRPDREAFIRDKLLLMSDEADNPEFIETRLRNPDQSSPARLRILAAYYFKTGKINQAFEIHRLLGWSSSKDVNRWLSFAENLRKDQRLSDAVKAYQEILAHVNQGKQQQTGRALLGLAQTFEDQIVPHRETESLSGFLPGNRFFTTPYYFRAHPTPESLQNALALYDSILVTMKRSKFTAAAHLRLGEIQFRITRDFDRALANYQSALEAGPGRDETALIRLRLGQLYLARGNPEGARAYFKQWKRKNPAFQSPYFLALFLSGDLDRLESGLDSTLTGMTGAERDFNDMAELQDLLATYYRDGSEEDRKMLKRWSQAEQLLWSDKLNEAAEELAWTRKQPIDSDLQDLLLWREAELRRLMNQSEESMTLAQQLAATEIGDHGWLLLGEVLEFDLGDRKKALEAYYHILNDWPQSILYEPVRLHIRELTQNTES